MTIIDTLILVGVVLIGLKICDIIENVMFDKDADKDKWF